MSPAEHTYYEGPALVGKVEDAIRAAGLDPENLALDELGPLDEFHALGRPATLSLADLAAVAEGEELLDVGAGIGGPSRLLAARRGARVTSLDPTDRFCDLNEFLCRATGMTGSLRVVRGSGLEIPFGDASFDLAWTQAVLQSVADKATMLAEMARVVRPGGRVAMFEVLTTGTGELEFPVPWGDGPEESFMVTSAELRSLVEGAGLEVREWREGADVVAAIGQVAASEPPLPENGLDLSLLMPDFQERMAGLATNVAQGRIAMVQVVAARP